MQSYLELAFSFLLSNYKALRDMKSQLRIWENGIYMLLGLSWFYLAATAKPNKPTTLRLTITREHNKNNKHLTTNGKTTQETTVNAM